MIQIILLVPMPGLVEVIVGQHQFTVAIIALREEHIVEPLQQPLVEGILLHEFIKNRIQCPQAALVERLTFLFCGQPAGEGQCNSPQQPIRWYHCESLEERRLMIAVEQILFALKFTQPVNELFQDPVAA